MAVATAVGGVREAYVVTRNIFTALLIQMRRYEGNKFIGKSLALTSGRRRLVVCYSVKRLYTKP